MIGDGTNEEAHAGEAMREAVSWWANADVEPDAQGPLVSFIVVAEVMRPDGGKALRCGAFDGPDGRPMATWDIVGRMLQGTDTLLEQQDDGFDDDEDDDE